MTWNYLSSEDQINDIKKVDQKLCLIQFNWIVNPSRPFLKMNTFTAFYVIALIVSYIYDNEKFLHVDHGVSDHGFY